MFVFCLPRKSHKQYLKMSLLIHKTEMHQNLSSVERVSAPYTSHPLTEILLISACHANLSKCFTTQRSNKAFSKCLYILVVVVSGRESCVGGRKKRQLSD